MSIEKRLLGVNPSGDKPNVEDVFSTYLYTGTNDDGPNFAQTITNGIDLSGEGGLVWTKARDSSVNHALVDTVRGNTKYLESDTADGESTTSVGITGFNSDGYDLGQDSTWKFNVNNAYVSEYASWTFRKAPKFFDVVTYTGDGSAQTLSHNLGVTPGFIVIKATNYSDSWRCYHRSLGATKGVFLNLTNAESTTVNHWNDTEPTSTEFTVGTNGSMTGYTYVAYLFAHDPDDGMIACGSYTATGSPVDVDLGWEPQFIITRNASRATEWNLQDTMRGMSDNSWTRVIPNDSSADFSVDSDYIFPTATGFKVTSVGNEFGNAGDTVIYMAIRAPMMKEPEDATDVFAVYNCDDNTDHYPEFISGFPVDMALFKRTSGGDSVIASRMTGDKRSMYANTTAAEITFGTALVFDYMNGFYKSNVNNKYAWMWKRAKGFFDVVAYKGGTAPFEVNHSLGVAPEMMWVKNRGSSDHWAVYYGDATKYLKLDGNDGAIASPTYQGGALWGYPPVEPTDTAFTLGGSGLTNNGEYASHIAYLFASLDGISKVGSYTGNGTNQTIDCGFSNGARFVLIKRTDNSSNWKIMDTERGIVAGADSVLELDNTSAESSFDLIDPESSGFAVTGNTTQGMNQSGSTYIFLAIA